jgi:hypothetical protein
LPRSTLLRAAAACCRRVLREPPALRARSGRRWRRAVAAAGRKSGFVFPILEVVLFVVDINRIIRDGLFGNTMLTVTSGHKIGVHSDDCLTDLVVTLNCDVIVFIVNLMTGSTEKYFASPIKVYLR